MASTSSNNVSDRRKEVMLGDLPSDFLRLSPSNSATDVATVTGAAAGTQNDEQMARALQQQEQLLAQGQAQPQQQLLMTTGHPFIPANTRGRLSVTCVEARLNKNYGLVRMDPYCRLRVGMTVFETPTDVNGSKAPKWNRSVQCYLPANVNSIYVEVFDERAFTTDERVAWAHIGIPQSVFACDPSDDWYPLTGALGEAKEGMINLIFQFAPVDAPPANYVPISGMRPGQAAVNVQLNSHEAPQAAQDPATGQPQNVTGQLQDVPVNAPRFTDEDITEMSEMFPNVDKEVIRSVMEEKSGNKEAAVTALLSIASE